MESVNISRKYEASKTDTPQYFGPDLTKRLKILYKGFLKRIHTLRNFKKIVVLPQAVHYNEFEKRMTNS